MKWSHALVVAGILSFAGAAVATSWSLNDFKPRYMPVLIQVDTKGKVTDVSPSVELNPTFDRLLHQNLDEMITRPAMSHGRPVSSQFIINLALQVTPRKEGDYFVNFAYVSTSPVPSGSWYWVKIDGHRLALASRNNISPQQRVYFNEHRGEYRPANIHYQHTPTPAIQNNFRSTPATVSSPSPVRAH